MKDLKNRKGIIKIPQQIIDNDLDILIKCFEKIFVINVSTEFHDVKVFYCYSELFDVAKEGELIEYIITIETKEKKLKSYSIDKL